jgi:hypothetical protein
MWEPVIVTVAVPDACGVTSVLRADPSIEVILVSEPDPEKGGVLWLSLAVPLPALSALTFQLLSLTALWGSDFQTCLRSYPQALGREIRLRLANGGR